jgi:UDP-N-acetylmuramate dehydrogenase
VLSTVIQLESGDRDKIKSKMDELGIRRRESQPLDMPSGGSTFKRPVNGYAASLIEQAGLKGYMIGGAQVSEKHAGFVVNRGDATFDDIAAVIEHVQEVVYAKFGTMLELEVRVLV